MGMNYSQMDFLQKPFQMNLGEEKNLKQKNNPNKRLMAKKTKRPASVEPAQCLNRERPLSNAIFGVYPRGLGDRSPVVCVHVKAVAKPPPFLRNGVNAAVHE